MTMKVITMTMIVTMTEAGAGTVVPAVRGAAPWA